MTTSSLPEVLDEVRTHVWKKIETYLPGRTPQAHYDMVREYPERKGKYFRPALLVYSAWLHGGKKEAAFLPAAAVQVSEDWLLIHDDVEDKSLLRRGRPTLNVSHGADLAINAGDALHVIMWQIMSDCVHLLGSERGWPLFDKLRDVLLTTIEGQYLELSWINNGTVEISTAQYMEMIKHKTCAYTTLGPLQMGALVAGAKESQIAKIDKWALPFGYAFQIWDDVLNVVDCHNNIGKEFGGDIAEGKRTLLLIHLLAHVNNSDKKQIIEVYKKPRQQKSQAEIKFIIQLLEKYGSIDFARGVAISHAKNSLKIFHEYAASFNRHPAADFLAEAINFAATRTN